jgi:hypothetical protein
MCPIPKGFRDRDISLYSSKIVDKKEVLLAVSDTGIYYSNDKVATVSFHSFINGSTALRWALAYSSVP